MSSDDFVSLCKKGDLDKVKKMFLDNENMIDLHYKEDRPFRSSCTNGNLEIAKWLLKITQEKNSPINIHAKDERAMRISCEKGRLDVVLWLYEISVNMKSPINVYAKENYAFKWACKRNHSDVAQWLASFNDDYFIEIENNKIKKWKVLTIYDKIGDLSKKNDVDGLKEIFSSHEMKTMSDENDSDDDDSNKCLICQSKDEDLMINLKCQTNNNIYDHYYCMECFSHWYSEKKKKCIYCKTEISLKKAVMLS